jgi:curved DNA-binding protein CbpA
MVEKDYYKILGISPSASDEEVKLAFFRLAKKYHPDRHRDAKDGEFDIKFTQINEAYNLLKDKASRTEYDKRFKTVIRKTEGTAQDKYRSEELFGAAVQALKKNDVNSAIDLLKAAVRLEPDKAEYYSFLGTALAEKPRRLHEAREMCEKAVEIEPYDVDNYIRLGMVYRKAGLDMRARKQFEKALRWEPDHPVARKELGLSNSSDWVLRLKTLFGKRRGAKES